MYVCIYEQYSLIDIRYGYTAEPLANWVEQRTGVKVCVCVYSCTKLSIHSLIYPSIYLSIYFSVRSY